MPQYFCEYGGTWNLNSEVQGDVTITVNVQAKDEEQAKRRAARIVHEIVNSLPSPFSVDEDIESEEGDSV